MRRTSILLSILLKVSDLFKMKNFFKQNSPGKLFVLIFIFSVLIFLAHTLITKNAVFADGKFYFAYVRSWVFDRDVNLTNEFEILGIKPALNRQGLAVNTFAPGTPILWFFPYLTIDNLLRLADSQRLGVEVTYQLTVAITNIILGLFGLFLVYKVLRRYFGERVSLLSIIALFATTNLFFYIAVEPINSHSTSFFVSSLIFYYIFIRDRKTSYRDGLILGFLSGFAGSVRTQDILIVFLPAIYFLKEFKSKPKILFAFYLLLACGLVFGFLPQIYLWKIFFNFYFPPPGWGYGFSLTTPHIIHVLFNYQNGLFIFTPTVMIALIGLLFLRKSNKWFGFLGISYFLIQLYLISSWRDYTQGGSYSIRMIINTYPLLTLGYAKFLEKYTQKFGLKFTVTSVITLSFLNLFLIIRYLLLY